MAAPTVADLSAFVGESVNASQAEAIIAIVSAQAKSYTRGRGWDMAGEPSSDIRAVILTAAARLLTDTSQMVTDERMGPFAVSYRDGFTGWTTNELYVLNRYRERAQ
ncbi:hypothetical protein MINS_34170 [Mycolicibacterium insubricum]|jgi:hypothetical protein|uniref:Uncharacterized protein n=1 Tax=Mycolicibacterium insubricum TaxID=444597 RepID=A0A1X0DC18_9MYCO|nr:hypothetical protein BST26_12825 [Mycolicibacterium insubricum]BBZ67988.1 hypothetical protein MINS_34170 [Mycolicibacterium insubricum]